MLVKKYLNIKLNGIAVLLGVLLMIGAISCSSHKKSVRKKSKSETTVVAGSEKGPKPSKGLKGEEQRIVEEAFEWIGTKYEYGKMEKGVSTDCSGMVTAIYEKIIGCKLPRNSAKQAEFCKEIKQKDIKPGDLVFFITNSGSKINHVGIMIDLTQFIHAGTKGVTVSSLDTEYYKKRLQCIGRVPCMSH